MTDREYRGGHFKRVDVDEPVGYTDDPDHPGDGDYADGGYQDDAGYRDDRRVPG